MRDYILEEPLLFQQRPFIKSTLKWTTILGLIFGGTLLLAMPFIIHHEVPSKATESSIHVTKTVPTLSNTSTTPIFMNHEEAEKHPLNQNSKMKYELVATSKDKHIKNVVVITTQNNSIIFTSSTNGPIMMYNHLNKSSRAISPINAISLTSFDVDSDGFTDLLVVSKWGSCPQNCTKSDGEIGWLKHPGTLDGDWKYFKIMAPVPGLYSVRGINPLKNVELRPKLLLIPMVGAREDSPICMDAPENPHCFAYSSVQIQSLQIPLNPVTATEKDWQIGSCVWGEDLNLVNQPRLFEFDCPLRERDYDDWLYNYDSFSKRSLDKRRHRYFNHDRTQYELKPQTAKFLAVPHLRGVEMFNIDNIEQFSASHPNIHHAQAVFPPLSLPMATASNSRPWPYQGYSHVRLLKVPSPFVVAEKMAETTTGEKNTKVLDDAKKKGETFLYFLATLAPWNYGLLEIYPIRPLFDENSCDNVRIEKIGEGIELSNFGVGASDIFAFDVDGDGTDELVVGFRGDVSTPNSKIGFVVYKHYVQEGWYPMKSENFDATILQFARGRFAGKEGFVTIGNGEYEGETQIMIHTRKD